MRIHVLIIILSLMLLTAACAANVASPELPTLTPATPTLSPSPMPEPTDSPTPTDTPSSPTEEATSPESTSVPAGDTIIGGVYKGEDAILRPQHPAAGQENDELARIAKTALLLAAKRLDKSTDDVQVQEVQPVNWPDSSLGCPQPGMLYAQVITPGYKVIITADDTTYELHLNANGEGDFCPPLDAD